jgi:Ni/Co efflux regulator RcnB
VAIGHFLTISVIRRCYSDARTGGCPGIRLFLFSLQQEAFNMKSKVITSFVVASLLGTSAAAFAQPHGNDHRGPAHAAPHRGAPIHEAAMGRAGGPIPHSDWHKGDRLPAEYRDHNYVVDDWHERGLSAPPRGYHWVGVNGDYVLAAVATGVIANILANAR